MVIINDSIIILYPIGKLDISTSDAFEEQIFKTISDYPDHNIIINLTKVDMLSSTALKIFITTTRTLEKQNLKLKLVNANPFCQKTIDIVNLTKIIDVYDSIDKAIKSFETK